MGMSESANSTNSSGGSPLSPSTTPAPTRPVHKAYVYGSNTLEGVSLSAMNTESVYQDAFKSTIAQYALISANHVYIIGMTAGEGSRRGSTDSVTISWMLGANSDTAAKQAASSLNTFMTTDESSFVASLKAAGMTAVTDIEVVAAPKATLAKTEQDTDEHSRIVIIGLTSAIVCLCCVMLIMGFYLCANNASPIANTNGMREVHVAQIHLHTNYPAHRSPQHSHQGHMGPFSTAVPYGGHPVIPVAYPAPPAYCEVAPAYPGSRASPEPDDLQKY